MSKQQSAADQIDVVEPLLRSKFGEEPRGDTADLQKEPELVQMQSSNYFSTKNKRWKYQGTKNESLRKSSSQKRLTQSGSKGKIRENSKSS